MTDAIWDALADGRPRTSAEVVARLAGRYERKYVISRMHEMAKRGELLKTHRPRVGGMRLVAWFQVNRHWVRPTEPLLVMTCAEPTIEQRVRAHLEDCERTTVKATATALGTKYDSTKTALYRLHAAGLAQRYRDPADERIVWYAFRDAPTPAVGSAKPLPCLKHLRDADDRDWTPKPWVHPYSLKARQARAA